MGNSSTPYCISLTVRQIVLRIIVASSLSCFLINIITGGQFFYHRFQYRFFARGSIHMGLSIIPLSISLHHILRLWPRKKWLVRFDLIYSTIEFAFATGYLIVEILLVPQFSVLRFMLSMIAVAFLWLSIGASFGFMIWNLRTSQYRTIGCIYDFIETGTSSTSGQNSRLGRWSLLLGENTCKRRFGVDRMIIRGIRAVISIFCLLAMITLVYFVLVVQPMQQQLYLQTLWGGGYSGDSEVNVTLIVDLGLLHYQSRNPEQTRPNIDYKNLQIDLDIKWRPESLHVPCNNTGTHAYCSVPSPFSAMTPDDLVVTVNYTHALQHLSMSLLRTGVSLKFNAEGETDMNVILKTAPPPTQLYPGVHIFGTMIYSYRDIYSSSRDLSFGIPHYDRHLVANVQALIPDPEATSSSNSSNTTATLRLMYRGGYPMQSEYKIEREQSSNTVLGGLALLGGAWTFINGLFATIFGCSLLLVLFGIKPLSIYGLVHLFQRRRSLVDGGYTLSVEEQSRTVAVLREHLLDDNNDMKGDEASEETDQNGEQSILREIV